MTRTLEGTILAGPDCEATEGRVVIEGGEIRAIEEADVEYAVRGIARRAGVDDVKRVLF